MCVSLAWAAAANRHLFAQRLHEGVLRDVERVERKRENLRLLEEQIQLTKGLEAARDLRETAAASQTAQNQ